MKTNLKGKLILIVAVLLVFCYGIFGIPDNWTGEGLKAAMTKRIHLGLDLKGGTHLILQVQVDDAIRSEANRAVERLKDDLQKGHISYAEIAQPSPDEQPSRIDIKGVPPEQSADLRTLIEDRLPNFALEPGPDNTYSLTMRPQAQAQMKERAVQQAIETIRNRVDQLGVTEPVIQEHGLGSYQILVQLPGVGDPGRVKQVIKSTAMLEIRQALNNGTPFPSREAALAAHGGVLPANAELLPGRNIGAGSEPSEQWWLVTRRPVVAGQDLRDAQPGRDPQTGRLEVNFSLTGEAGRRFGEFTGSNVGNFLAVVLDDRVVEVARIQDQIRDEGRITGQFSDQQVKDLAMVLRSGALPAGINYLEERTVGPSLGADSIRAGVTAALVGIIVVMIFMLVYYRGAGINADLALVLNLVILLGFLGYTGATLTLPGIAGVILTIGMGVDSNVLIFERIREELEAGKTTASAVDQGFGRAWLTIVDTHVTTIVSAFILFIFGTGPVRGFAVTLTFGLLANLFTAVFVSRVIFDYVLSRKQRGEALSI